MTQKEIYEKARLEASKKYRDEINELKTRNIKMLKHLRDIEAINKRLVGENQQLRCELDKLNANPFATRLITEMTEVLSVLK